MIHNNSIYIVLILLCIYMSYIYYPATYLYFVKISTLILCDFYSTTQTYCNKCQDISKHMLLKYQIPYYLFWFCPHLSQWWRILSQYFLCFIILAVKTENSFVFIDNPSLLVGSCSGGSLHSMRLDCKQVTAKQLNYSSSFSLYGYVLYLANCLGCWFHIQQLVCQLVSQFQ